MDTATTTNPTPTPTPLECLDAGERRSGSRQPDEPCMGAVELREPLSGTGRAYPRCDAHWSKRLDLQERLRRDYPDSPHAPSWFDPSAAGEHWDSDY